MRRDGVRPGPFTEVQESQGARRENRGLEVEAEEGQEGESGTHGTGTRRARARD